MTTGFEERPHLDVPDRPADALSGTEIWELLEPLSQEAREQRILAEVLSGNVPPWLRPMRPVTVTGPDGAGQIREVVFWVTPDYIALGSADDWALMPMSGPLAQAVADGTSTTLPTRRMVNGIHTAAMVKLQPRPIPPSPAMVTIPVFADHNEIVEEQRLAAITTPALELGALVGGHKKDIVLTPRLIERPTAVAIYGWHYPNGSPIQPLYLGHGAFYADYSHGVRLIHKEVFVDGHPYPISEVLTDTTLSLLLSDEGILPPTARYGNLP